MVVTIYKYTIENNLTKKREKKKKEKHTQINGIYSTAHVISSGITPESLRCPVTVRS